MVLMAVCLCQPVLFMTGIDTRVVSDSFYLLHYFMFFAPLLMALVALIRGNKVPYVPPIVLSFFYLLLGFIYQDQIYNYLYVIVCCHVCFYVSYYDRICVGDMYRVFTALFLLTTAYAFFEFHFHLGPYISVYLTSSSYDNYYTISRAVGLLGNPLLLCCVAVFFLALTFNNSFIKERVSLLMVLICIYVLLIVVSRTAVAAFLGMLFFYIVCSRQYKSLVSVFALFLVIIAAYFLANYYLGDVIDNLRYRMMYSERTHRLSGIETTYNILQSRPFGLGAKDFGTKVLPFAGAGKEEGINTLDNFFFTQIAYYGLLGIVVIYFYLFYFIRSFRYRKSQPSFFKQIMMLFVAFFLIGLSFDLEAYSHITTIVYGLLGILFSNYIRVSNSNES